MANKLDVTPAVVASEALMHLEDALVIGSLAYSDKTPEFNKVGGYAVGDSVTIKTRPEYSAEEFTSAIVIQDIREASATFEIEKHFDISIEITSRERALDLDSLSEQVIMPAAYELARATDEYLGTKVSEGRGLYFPAAVGGLFSTAADMALARKMATEQQIALLNRFGILDLGLEAKLLGADFFNQVQIRGQDAIQSLIGGRMGSQMGADWWSSINMPTGATVTNGTLAGVTNNGVGNLVGETGLIYDGGSGTTVVGDRLKIAGVKRPVIVASVTTGATGTVTLAHQIDEVIPDNAAITTIASGLDTSTRGAVFDKRAMGFAMPPLDQPPGADSAVVSNNGLSMRVVSDYDISSKKETMSIDLLVGAKAYDPRRILLLAEQI